MLEDMQVQEIEEGYHADLQMLLWMTLRYTKPDSLTNHAAVGSRGSRIVEMGPQAELIERHAQM